jgi:hypothetical protein
MQHAWQISSRYFTQPLAIEMTAKADYASCTHATQRDFAGDEER